MAMLDGTVVNVALPVMQRDLQATAGVVQWIVEAYALALAALVLVGGALGDRFGRKRVFVIGVIAFALASMACGAAPSGNLLIAARGIQGVGAALLVPGSLSLISAAYTEKEARGAAIGTWSAVSAMTTAIGPVACGWVVTHASWRWLFYFNAPVAVVVVLLATIHVDETRDETASKHIDWMGALFAASGLGLVVYALIDTERSGGVWTTEIIALFSTGIVMLGAFIVAEARQQAPMMPLSLFRSRSFSGTNLLTLMLYAALGGGFFFLPFDLIQVQHYSPAAAGGALLPLILIISLMSRSMGGVAERIGPRIVLTIGPIVAAVGFALFALPGVGGSYWTTFFPGVIVLGIGMGMTVAPLTSTVMGSVDSHHAGVASGINNAVSRAAGLLAVAALGVILAARFNSTLDRALGSLSLSEDVLSTLASQRSKLAAPDLSSLDLETQAVAKHAFEGAFVAGFRAVMLTCSVLAGLGGVAGFALVEARQVAPKA
jgi:EmrB/QacA subfamily drug resistance transporter